MTDAVKTPSKTEFVLSRPNLPVADVLKEAEAANVPLTSSYVYKIRVRAGQGKRAAKRAANENGATKASTKAPSKRRAAKVTKPAAVETAKAEAPKGDAAKAPPRRSGRTKKVASVAAPKPVPKVATPKAAPANAAPTKPATPKAAPAKAAAPKAAPAASAAATRRPGRPKASAAPLNTSEAALRRIVIELGVSRTRHIVDDIAKKLEAILAGA